MHDAIMDQAMSEALTNSYRQVLDEIGCGELRIQEENASPRGVDFLCTVGLTGTLQGYMVLCFSGNDLVTFSRHLNQRFDMGQPDNDKDFMRESLAELANQLGGRSVMGLSSLGIDCLITPPTVISGTQVEAMIPHLEEKRQWLVSSPAGVFTVAVMLKKR